MFIPVPVLFDSPEDESYFEGAGVEAVNPLINAIVLRNHIIMPDTLFKDVARKRLIEKLGKSHKVHFINALWYEQKSGSIHCATMIVRDISHVFKFK